eukprot:GHVU01055400.1.p1 GENE.GHVU01055400.1~~GHVU01055400.1.p1  ORF type:complete len:105 (+),score=7.31 GHVU01055400.1:85-399(+)
MSKGGGKEERREGGRKARSEWSAVCGIVSMEYEPRIRSTRISIAMRCGPTSRGSRLRLVCQCGDVLGGEGGYGRARRREEKDEDDDPPLSSYNTSLSLYLSISY